MRIPDPVAVQARFAPTHLAYIGHEEQCSFAELDQRVNGIVATLREAGVKGGDVVAFVATKEVPRTISLFWALFRIGAIAQPLSRRLPPSSISSSLSQSGCSFVIGDKIQGSLVPHVELDFDKLGELSNPEVSLVSEALATIVQTSGSTGKPKLAVHSIGNHFYSAWGSLSQIALISEDRWLLSIPMNHVGGLGIMFRCFNSGAAIVIDDGASPTMETVRTFEVTHLSLVSTQLRRLVEAGDIRDGSGLKSALCGGSAIPERLVRSAIKAGLPVRLTYGLTEASSQVATSSALVGNDIKSFRPKCLKHVQIKIDEGEILIRGDTVFQGYLEEGKIQRAVNNDGWFRTSDLGKINNRFLTVTGRRDNMFVSGGENIQPEEIENLLTSFAEINTAVVLSIADREFGYRPVAVVSLRPDQLEGGSKEGRPEYRQETAGVDGGDQIVRNRPKEFNERLGNLLPKYKLPVHYYLLPERFLEVSKIERGALLDMLLKGQLDPMS